MHADRLFVVVDGDVDGAAERSLDAGAGPAATGEVVADQALMPQPFPLDQRHEIGDSHVSLDRLMRQLGTDDLLLDVALETQEVGLADDTKSDRSMPDAISRGCSMWRAMILVIVSISWAPRSVIEPGPISATTSTTWNRASGFKPWRRRASVMAAPIVGWRRRGSLCTGGGVAPGARRQT
jgi:hypothetical protein